MTSSALQELAKRHGVVTSYVGPDGSDADVPSATIEQILTALGLDVSSEPALRRQLDEARDRELPVMEVREAARCYLPEWLEDRRGWGIALQLYELRSRRNWGIGDFADLKAFCSIAATAGADFIGLNPLHALALAAPSRSSPFSPSNRRFLNPLYIAVDDVPGFTPDLAAAFELERLRDMPIVDYEAVAALKLTVLDRLWRDWKAGRSPRSDRYARGAHSEFVAEAGEALQRHALFEARSLTRDAGARAEDDAVAFHGWLQWLAHVQLDEARSAATAAGMRIGLYLDFAVGEDPHGSAVWGDADLFMPKMSIGAPPDFFTANGQNWGLSPLSPRVLEDRRLVPYRQMMQDAMHFAGALRLDHAMSLWQLFLVPHGKSAAEGAYIRYPVADMLDILAELSNRYRTVMIGEDLGHVPEGFRPLLEKARILSYRILYFEMDRTGAFVPPQDYPRLALACLSTHDLPTFIGWWRGSDIGLRLEHGLIDADAAERQAEERASNRRALIEALVAHRALAPADLAGARAAAEAPDGEVPTGLVVAAHRFIARTAACLAGVRLADLVGESEPTNLPGTIDSYPNWQLKSSVSLEEVAGHPAFEAITKAMNEERPRRP